MKRLLFLTLTCIIFSACDPAFTFSIDHSKRPHNSITIYYRKSGYMGFLFPDVLRVSNDDTCCNKDFFRLFGVGTWDKDKLTAFAKSMDSIHITHKDKSFSLKTQQQLYDYLLIHRKGMMKQRIVIKLK